MKIFLDGDKGKAICDRCGGIVDTTFQRRDVPFSDGSGLVRNLLVGVCDSCDAVVSIPAQSTPAIRRARKPAPDNLEANLPAVYVDLLDYAVYTIDEQASTDFRRLLLTYFVHRDASDPRSVRRLRKAHDEALARYPEPRGVPRRRLSLKVPPRVSLALRQLEEDTELNTTELIKSVVCEIQDAVLERPQPAVIQALRTLSAVAG